MSTATTTQPTISPNKASRTTTRKPKSNAPPPTGFAPRRPPGNPPASTTRSRAKRTRRLGTLDNASDYPTTLDGLFDLEVSYPTNEPQRNILRRARTGGAV
jgi:hypothetical protein